MLTNRKNTALVTISACLSQFAMPAMAEEASGGVHGIESIVVTATRRAEALQEVPASVTAVSGNSLKKMGFTNSQDLASQMPGLNIMGPFNLSSPQISVRGVGNNGFNANSVSTVGVYSDEVYLNQSIGHGFQLFDLQRVELLRGPQGTVYGANATSGALNYISKRPMDHFGAEASLTYGKYNELKADGVVNVPLTDSLSARVSGAYNKNDGYRRNVFLKTDAGFVEDFAWRGIVEYKPNSDLDISVKVHGARARNDGAQYEQQGVINPTTFAPCGKTAIAAGQCTDFFGYSESRNPYSNSSDVRGFENINVFGVSPIIDWNLDWAVLRSITAYEKTNRSEKDELDGSPFDELQDQLDSHAHQFSEELRLSSNHTTKLNWILGAYYFDEKSNEFYPLPARGFGPGGLSGASSVIEGAYRYYTARTKSQAVYADLTYNLTDRLAIRGGVRYSHESLKFNYQGAIFDATGTNADTTFSLVSTRQRTLFPTIAKSAKNAWNVPTGRAVVEYKIQPEILVYASYARGFRSGNFNSGALFSNAELTLVDPEYIDAFEIGLKSTLFDGRATFNTSAFHYNYTNQQVTTVISGQQLMANAASSTIWGGEAELAASPIDNLTLNLGLSLLHATYDQFISPTGANLSGNKLENAPNVTLNGLASYQWDITPDFNLILETDVSYKGAFYLDFSNDVLSKQKGYWLQNLSVSIDPSNEKYRVTLWMKNAWDQTYRTNWADLSGFGYNLNSFGAPRTFGITLSAKI